MKEYKYKINGNLYNVVIGDMEENIVHVEVNGTHYTVETEKKVKAAAAPKPVVRPAARPAAAPAAGLQVKSPLPGSVIKVLVSEGQAVKKGDTLLTLESMKMENAIMAEQDGTVKQIAVTPGQNVMQDDLLVVLG